MSFPLSVMRHSDGVSAIVTLSMALCISVNVDGNLLAEPAWQVFIRDRLATPLVDSSLNVVYATADLPEVSSAAFVGCVAW
jgi:hypothetical protein